MIIVKLIGGLGNQMFQYSTALALSRLKRTELFIDLSELNKSIGGGRIAHKLELDAFNIQLKIAPNEEVLRLKKLGEKKIIRALHRFFPFLFPAIYAAESGLKFHSQFVNYPSNTYLNGYWQNQKYFSSIKSELYQLFTPKLPPSQKVNEFIQKINSHNSVSVHVRRGDYLMPEISNYHGNCDIGYYKEAMRFMSKEILNPVFFVFSNDLEWCKLNLPSNFNLVFVNHNDENFWDMLLMSYCKHNIIANSSFSWWGAWLNKNSNKIVVAPEYWYNKVRSKEIDIVDKSWILV
jgi:hypothetical protein